MKVLTAALSMLLAASCFGAKSSSSQIVDVGSFSVFLNGKRVATEAFKIEQRGAGSVAESELKADDGTAQRSQMELTSQGDIVHYAWQELEPSKATLSVEPKEEFLTEIISSGPKEKTFNVPHVLPHSTPILDDNFFIHREILIWRYMAAGCTTKPEGLACNPAPQQFGVLVPTQHTSEAVTVSFKGTEKISVEGKEISCNTFRMQTDNGDWLVYLNADQKLVRIVAPAAGLEVVRN